ncbi:hypothetical protein [Nonomuraea typhae]|nr:hypothetical protein [Nonomuraea typhae]
MSEKTEAELTTEGVDVRQWGPSEGDEELVLRALYGEPDQDGVYRGVGSA